MRSSSGELADIDLCHASDIYETDGNVYLAFDLFRDYDISQKQRRRFRRLAGEA
jgi:hypothetical protein